MNKGEQKLHPFGHGGDIRTAVEAAGISTAGLLDFSANINPLGLPTGLIKYLQDKLPEITSYPDPACRKLLEAIINRYQPSGTVLPGNGAGELIYLLMRALPSGPVLVWAPTFILYEKAALAAGRRMINHTLQHERNFQPDVSAFCRQILTAKPALTFLCNPNNPTGTILNRQDVLTVAEACVQAGSTLVVDEAFLEFCPDWQERTMLQQSGNIFVLCSLTKLYAIPGLRLGFVTGPPSVISQMGSLRDPWSVNVLAQHAGEYVLQDRKFATDSANTVTRLARELFGQLQQIPDLLVYPPAANYIFIESKRMTSAQLQWELLQEKIVIRDCSNYRGLDQRFIRVAVRTESENKALVTAFQKIFNFENGGTDEANLDSSRRNAVE